LTCLIAVIILRGVPNFHIQRILRERKPIVSDNHVPKNEDPNPETQKETEGTAVEIKTGVNSGPQMDIGA